MNDLLRKAKGEQAMICCKIIADYSNESASFAKLCELLAKKGEFLWENNAFYFADTKNQVTEKQLTSCVKRAGYTKVFIETYDALHEPHEAERLKGWITDKLVKIFYKTTEQQNQDLFSGVKEELNEINERLDKLLLEQSEKKETEDNINGRN